MFTRPLITSGIHSLSRLEKQSMLDHAHSLSPTVKLGYTFSQPHDGMLKQPATPRLFPGNHEKVSHLDWGGGGGGGGGGESQSYYY